MDYYFFTFRSITRAQLALRYLQAADVRAALLRTPKALATEGCGYVIRVRAADAAAADQLFSENQVRYQRRFIQRGGRYQEVLHGLS